MPFTPSRASRKRAGSELDDGNYAEREEQQRLARKRSHEESSGATGMDTLFLNMVLSRRRDLDCARGGAWTLAPQIRGQEKYGT